MAFAGWRMTFQILVERPPERALRPHCGPLVLDCTRRYQDSQPGWLTDIGQSHLAHPLGLDRQIQTSGRPNLRIW